jgi:hypothetical protein
MITETSTGLMAFGETKVNVQLRRLMRLAALAATAIGAAVELAVRYTFQRGPLAAPWRAGWQTRWARRALRAMHCRMTVYGHAPARGVLVCNDAGPLARLGLAALRPTSFLLDPHAIEEAISDDGVVSLFMKHGGVDRVVLEQALRGHWPLAATWIQTMQVDLWTLLAEPAVPLTIALAPAERARGTALSLDGSLADQVRLLAHAT